MHQIRLRGAADGKPFADIYGTSQPAAMENAAAVMRALKFHEAIRERLLAMTELAESYPEVQKYNANNIAAARKLLAETARTP